MCVTRWRLVLKCWRRNNVWRVRVFQGTASGTKVSCTREKVFGEFLCEVSLQVSVLRRNGRICCVCTCSVRRSSTFNTAAVGKFVQPLSWSEKELHLILFFPLLCKMFFSFFRPLNCSRSLMKESRVKECVKREAENFWLNK